MDPYYSDDEVTVYHGDCLDVLAQLPDASISAVITDPPYGLEFMGKEWDGSDGFRRSLNAADVDRNHTISRGTGKDGEPRLSQRLSPLCSPVP